MTQFACAFDNIGVKPRAEMMTKEPKLIVPADQLPPNGVIEKAEKFLNSFKNTEVQAGAKAGARGSPACSLA